MCIRMAADRCKRVAWTSVTCPDPRHSWRSWHCQKTSCNPYMSAGWPFRLACSLCLLARVARPIQVLPWQPEFQYEGYASGHIPHLCNLHCDCLSQQLTSLSFLVCAHVTCHLSTSCPISHCTPLVPYAFITALCPFWHSYCLDTEFECLPLLRLPSRRYRWNRLVLYFPESPENIQSWQFFFLAF
jgi:hypothetical protein